MPISGLERALYARIVALVAAPVLLLGAYSLFSTHRHLSEGARSRRMSAAALAAAMLEAKFDQAVSVGVALATRVRFSEMVSAGKWEEAMRILRESPRDFPFVERLFLADVSGVLRADAPTLPGVRGRSFAERDWYKGVTRQWRPYVSTIYRRAAEPRLDVIAVAVPVRDKKGAPSGILVLQLRLESLLAWGRDMGVMNSRVCFVDPAGKAAIAYSPEPEGRTADLSKDEVVLRALRGERGVDIRPDALRGPQLAAYEPVGRFGWAVLTEQPVSLAYGARNRVLRWLAAAYGLTLALSVIFGVALSRMLEELNEARAKAERSSAELARANKELEAFSYSVSHDLRAPLRAVDGYSRMLGEDFAPRLDDEGRRYLERIQEGCARMGRLIDELLHLSQVSRRPIARAPVDAAELARSAAEQLRREQPGRSVEFVVPERLMASADAGLLRLALENLLSNAWKFSSKVENARVELGALDKDGERVYFVRDNGAGFDMAYAGKLFGAFQRLHGQDDFPGHGVGLASVQRVVQRHGGRVWAEGEVGRGATFYFTLPPDG